MIELVQHSSKVVPRGETLDTDDPLCGCGQHLLRRELLFDVMLKAETLQSRRSQDDRVEVTAFQPGNARVDVATQRLDGHIGPHQLELGLASQARAADTGALRQRVQAGGGVADEGVRVVRALQHCRDTKPVGHFRRHVLHRMHGDIGVTGLHRNFEFLDEQALAADLLQAAVEDLVASRRQGNEFHGPDVGQSLQQVCDVFSLPECERTLARCDPDIQ